MIFSMTRKRIQRIPDTINKEIAVPEFQANCVPAPRRTATRVTVAPRSNIAPEKSSLKRDVREKISCHEELTYDGSPW
jgi:hypothetical protein